MYPVSTSYKSKIKELTRVFKAQLQIQHSLGVLDLTDADIVGGSLAYTEASQAGEDFTIGGVVASDLSVEILNKPEYATYNFMGAMILVSIGLEVSPDTYEYVPLGVFNVDDVGKTRNAISLKALDNMIKFDKPYSMSNLIYPANLLQIFNDACTVCGVTPGTATFLNSNYVVQERPEGDLTFRDILSYVAELSGSFARCNRTGAVELAWYEPTGLTLAGANRFDFRPSDDLISIKGVMATVGDTTYLAGSDEYAVDLTHNPLLQSDHQTVLASIFAAIKDTSFYPFESSWQGNPAIQAGDMLIQIDRDGKQWPAIVTSSTYKYRGSSVLKAQGLPVTAKGFKGSTNKKITNIVRAAQKETEIKLTTLEQAQLNATELVANMLGGHAIRRDDAFYIADNPNLDAATKVWKWGAGGFGYSSTGVEGPYTTAITADGTIVAMLVAANIVTADMVKTGILQSEDGSTVINLNDGSFNFKNAIKWEGGKLSTVGLLEEGKQYGAVVMSALKGLQVLDDLNKERVRLGRFEALGEQTATFARNSTAYLSDGTEVAANVPRFEEVDGETGLLVEEGTTNLIPIDKQNFENWSMHSGASVTITQNQTVEEWGTSKATRIQTSGGTHVIKYYLNIWTPADGESYLAAESVWIKVPPTSPPVRIYSNLGSGSTYIQPGESKRISITVSGIGNGITQLHIQIRAPNVDDSLDFYAWRPQIEKKPYPTSFHPTTRASDQLLVPTSGLSPTKGMWEQRVYVTDVAKRQSGYPTIFNIPQNNGNAGIWLYHNSANWVLETRDFTGASTSVNVSDSYTPNGHHTFHVSWNTSKAVLFIDGVERGVISNPKLPSAFAANATVGYQGTDYYLNTHIGAIRHSSEPRTDLSDWETLPLDEHTTYLMRMDGNLQPTEGGAYGLLVRDKSGQKTILDENGILQTWQEGRADNVESGKPLVLSVFLPSETRQVNKAILRFKRQKFRAYSKSAKAGGDHRHMMMEFYDQVAQPGTWYAWAVGEIGGGTAGYIVTGVPTTNKTVYTKGASGDHVHDIVYGIYEGTASSKVTVKINGVDRTSALGGGTGFDVDKDNLDITPYLQVGQWNVIELGSGTLGRIDSTVFIQALMGVS
jgi:hypothetical protein